MPNEKEQLTFISLAPKNQDGDQDGSYTFLQEVGHGAAACPREMYCLHATSKKSTNSPRGSDLVADGNMIWSIAFDMTSGSFDSSKATNVFLCDGPKFEVDYDENIAHSRELFTAMYPSEPFLPRAPDPEEIVIGETEGEDG